MTISIETIGRLYASGRNYVNSGLGLLTGIGLMSAAQNKSLTDSLAEIYNGVSQIVHGATSAWQIIAVVAAPILTPIIARYASKSATTNSQAAAIKAAIVDPNTPITPEVKATVLEAATEVKKI